MDCDVTRMQVAHWTHWGMHTFAGGGEQLRLTKLHNQFIYTLFVVFICTVFQRVLAPTKYLSVRKGKSRAVPKPGP